MYKTLANNKWHYWSTAAGLKIIFGRWPHTMTVQRNFCLVKSRFWPVKILGKKLTNPCAIFYCNFLVLFSILQREKNPGFTGKDLVGCSRIRVSQECAWQVNVTGEWSCGRTRCHSGRTPEGRTRYFELCPRRVDIVPFNKISSLSGDFNWFKHFRYIFKLDYWDVNAVNLWQADIIWKPS